MQTSQLLEQAIAGDGGAASQLAAALKIDIVWYPTDVWAQSGGLDASEPFAEHGGDRYAAMNQAIVRVAKAMAAQS